ncbi:hypothetical protein pah_c028o032 [Parachlamydia acanthamoebae str. Hall's coccus]|nr:hypothetical protein pah_c028o032 [Parachlamydia acanthamoebae str. Hall's coccus]
MTKAGKALQKQGSRPGNFFLSERQGDYFKHSGTKLLRRNFNTPNSAISHEVTEKFWKNP